METRRLVSFLTLLIYIIYHMWYLLMTIPLLFMIQKHTRHYSLSRSLRNATFQPGHKKHATQLMLNHVWKLPSLSNITEVQYLLRVNSPHFTEVILQSTWVLCTQVLHLRLWTPALSWMLFPCFWVPVKRSKYHWLKWHISPLDCHKGILSTLRQRAWMLRCDLFSHDFLAVGSGDFPLGFAKHYE